MSEAARAAQGEGVGLREDWSRTAQEAALKDGIYDSTISRGMAVGYFMRRIEEVARL